jgi:diguanylate cyclase (GGDEF)-like protein
MAAFFRAQLDYILFFYGLAFVLVGAICFALYRKERPDLPWLLLGVFALCQGLLQWVGVLVVGLGDTQELFVVRLVLLTASFVALIEFWRRSAAQLFRVVAAPWVYAPIILLTGLALWHGGLVEFSVAARYVLGITGTVGTAVVFYRYARVVDGARRRWLRVAASLFVLFAVADGAVVPAAAFPPAAWLNEESFFRVTDIPVQLIRSVLACAMAASLWAYAHATWWHRVAAPRSATARRHFAATAAMLVALVGLGWVTTEYIGRLYHDDLRRDLDADLNLLVRTLGAEMTVADNVARAMAQAPALRNFLLAPGDEALARANIAVDSFHTAAGPSLVFLVNVRGTLVAASLRVGRASVIGVEVGFRPYFQDAMRGMQGAYFALGTRTLERGYYASAPVLGPAGNLIGVAVVKKELDAFESELRGYGDCYVISPDGIVFLSGRPEMLFRTLWPIDPFSWALAVKSRQFGAIDATPLFDEEIRDGEWARLDARNLLVGRRRLNEAGWSLLRLVEAPETIFNRLFGIAITLLVCSLALVYYVALQRRIDSETVLAAKQQELERLTKLLEQQATTDALTGAANRLKFNAMLEEEMQRASRYGTPLSLVMYDIDWFKVVNDTGGHRTGDTVLVRLTQLVAANLRQSDTLVRWGGEEFVILAPNTDIDAAAVLAEKLRILIARSDLGAREKITCSFGVTRYRAGESFESFTSRVDAALYQAKHDGRNRVAQAA